MKKVLARVFIGLLFAYGVAVSIAVLTPLNPFGNGTWLTRGGDFMLRVTEIDCLLDGTNPYDVWHGDIVKKPYIPNYGEARRAVEGQEGFTEEINAYAPWEYIMMMPFALLPLTFSWLLYFALMLAGLVVLYAIGRSFAERFAGCDRATAALAGAVPILLAGLPIYQNFHVGNLAVPVLLASALMAVCLNRGHDVLAGVCWAFAMMKPQLGLVFAIPLLMRRRFSTCFVAAGICLVLTVVASFICGASPIALIVQTPAANTFAFNGCGTFPLFLCSYLPGDLDIVAGLLVGAVVCVVLTTCLVRSGVRDWIVLFMPAAVIGASWTYAQCYSFAMNWFFFSVLVAALARFPGSRFLWCIAVLSLLPMTRINNLAHTIQMIRPDVIPEFLPLKAWHYHIDSLVSLAGIFVVAALSICIVRVSFESCKMGK